MAKTKPGQRVVLQLDPRIALEAIILNRLERIPTTRRQEWLRGLLVQGFRVESRALRGAPDDSKRTATTAFTNWLAGEAQEPAPSKTASAVMQITTSNANTAGKPFAALGKVIG